MKNKKLLIIIPLMLLVVLTLVSATVDWSNDVSVITPLWEYDTSATGLLDLSSNGNDATAFGGVTYNTGKDAFIFDKTDDYVNRDNLLDLSAQTGVTLCTWINVDSSKENWGGIQIGSKHSGSVWVRWNLANHAFESEMVGSTGYNYVTSTNTFSLDTWYHVCGTYSNTDVKLYVDGVEDTTTPVKSSTLPKFSDFTGAWSDKLLYGALAGTGSSDKITDYFGGELSDGMVFTKVLTSTEISDLYGEGRNYNPYADGSSPAFSVTAKDLWSDTAINSFWAIIDGTTYTTTNGTINTALYQNDTNTYNLEVGATDYFSETYSNIAVDTNYEAILHQSEIDFNSYETITNNSISNCNYTINGVQDTTFYLNAGEHTVLVECPSYYAVNHTFTVTSLDQQTENIYDIYNNKITINLKDILTDVIINKNSTIILTNTTYGFNQTYNSNDGTFNINLTQLNYDLQITANDYANYENSLTVNSLTQENNYSLYANNSVWVYAYDTDTGATLTNFNVEIYDDNNTYDGNESGGYAQLNNIPSGVYTVLITRSGYTNADYSLTMTGGSHQRVNAYLNVDSSDTVDFTVSDLVSATTLENVDVSQYRTVGGSWTLTSNKQTDLTGRARFTRTTGIEYKFVFSITGYETRTIYLEPLFSSYTIRLTSNTQEEPNTNGFYTTITPHTFEDDAENNLTFTISSAGGTLEYYYINITAPNVSIQNNYSTANGGEYNYQFNIANSILGNKLKVNYVVKETGKNPVTYHKEYYINNNVEKKGFSKWGDNDAGGMKDFEKALLSTFLLLIITSLVAIGSTYAGVNPLVPTGITFIIFLAILSILHFVPLWSLYISGLALFLIIIFSLRSN